MAVNSVSEFGRVDLSQLDYTYDLLTGLTDDELEAVQRVAIIFLRNKNKGSKGVASSGKLMPFQPQTEEQLLARIDKSISQIDSGACEDLDDVVKEMLAEMEE